MKTQTITRNNIMHGFKENGMIDSKSLTYPNFDKILATCRLDPTTSEYELYKNLFPKLLELYKEIWIC